MDPENQRQLLLRMRYEDEYWHKHYVKFMENLDSKNVGTPVPKQQKKKNKVLLPTDIKENLPGSKNNGTHEQKQKKTNEEPIEIRKNFELRKYWKKRFSLFSKFDQGIQLDEESWYSVTPEQVAKRTAERCKCNIIVDAFCGAGGNAIQFALTCNRVIAIDIDPRKIEMAKNNAQIYGVANKIQFITGDFLELADILKADVVFLSPPWGGPTYAHEPVYDLEEMLQPVPWSKLLVAARQVSLNIAAFLPRNVNTSALTEEAGSQYDVDIEKNILGMKWIGITSYYNDLVKKK